MDGMQQTVYERIQEIGDRIRDGGYGEDDELDVENLTIDLENVTCDM